MYHLYKRQLCLAIGLCSTSTAYAHYPILNCAVTDDQPKVSCEASFSNQTKAPNIVMEVYSESDDLIASGTTDSEAMFYFPLPQGNYFILMDAGPGHVLEISNDEVTTSKAK